MTTVDSIIPAKPSRIRTVANHFKTKSSDLDAVSTSVKDLPRITPSWEGDAADAFESKANELSGDAVAQSEIYSDAHTFLMTVADVFVEYRSLASDLIAQLSEFKDDPDALELINQDIDELRTAGKNVADHAATELLGILDGYAESVEGGGGRESKDDELQPVELSREENFMLYALLQGEGAIGDNELQQGGIGNCYILADLISMMSSEEGSDFLRRSIRPVFSDKDGEIIGWEVRVYGDDKWYDPNDEDPEVWQTVTHRYADPSEGRSQPETLAWLFERAYGQMFGHHSSGHGGHRDTAFENLMGTDATKVIGPAEWVPWKSKAYTEDERAQVIDAINDGRPVTAGTGSTIKPFSEYWDKIPKERDGGYESYMPVALGGVGGDEVNIKIYGSHAYAIVGADEHGVTMVNPHGWNPVEGRGSYTESGKFYVTWGEFEHRFGDVAIGGEYRQ